ncbi:alpha/beta hydrolase [Rhodococcoides kyotonense]|uniref:Acetyl esterase/lipase n=1 Tax=Rhodococcoides kyotonense TaxID=398843 RepID=A0A239M2N0_9NOCA|nr:alpha/beta hydrolase [Rhodococcus kyotonensis]SNT36941.1 Acetyl esterase/lipase [Rhodococcus kyotonensis]
MDGWRSYIAAQDEAGEAALGTFAASVDADVEEIEVDGVTVYVSTPRDLPADDQAVYLDIHGGALLWGGGPSCRYMSAITAGMTQSRVWSPDYRLPPDHPFPAGIDDCLTVYRALLRQRQPENIVVGGASAGGNLAASALLRARDEGTVLPAGIVLLTPEIDLTESGDSFNTMLGIDTGLTDRLMPANLVYAGGHDLSHPYLSPLFGDFAAGFPPAFLQSGTRDLFLSNTVRMHEALRNEDVPADLFIQDAATHIGFAFGPEANNRNRLLRKFLDDHWIRSVD